MSESNDVAVKKIVMTLFSFNYNALASDTRHLMCRLPSLCQPGQLVTFVHIYITCFERVTRYIILLYGSKMDSLDKSI